MVQKGKLGGAVQGTGFQNGVAEKLQRQDGVVAGAGVGGEQALQISRKKQL